MTRTARRAEPAAHGPARPLVAFALARALQLFVRLGTRLRLFALSESGTERLREGPGLVVANHPTPLDVVFLISCMPQADCIVKREA